MAEDITSSLISRVASLERRIQVMERMDVQPGRPKFTRGRLTLVSGNPFLPYYGSVVDTLYWTPCYGGIFDEISIKYTQQYDGVLVSGSAIVTRISATQQISPGMGVSGTGIAGGTTVLSVDSDTQITLSANATANGLQTLSFTFPNYVPTDIFYFQDKLIPRCWTSANVRAVNLSFIQGYWSLSTSDSYRYLGTVCGTGHSGNGFCNTYDRHYVWNAHNQIYARIAKSGNSAHTYSGAYRYWNNDSANVLSFVNGLSMTGKMESRITLAALQRGLADGVYSIASMGFNSTTPVAPLIQNSNNQYIYVDITLGLDNRVSVGYNYVTFLEASGGNAAFDAYVAEGALWS